MEETREQGRGTKSRLEYARQFRCSDDDVSPFALALVKEMKSAVVARGGTISEEPSDNHDWVRSPSELSYKYGEATGSITITISEDQADTTIEGMFRLNLEVDEPVK